MIPRLVAALAVALTAHTTAAQDGAPSSAFPGDATIRGLIAERVEQRRSAGIVVGLLEPDGTRRFIAHGDPGPGSPPLDGNSVFEIGSITKVFTGTLLAQMALAGEVALDDPVAKYLPRAVRMPERNGKWITLVHLAQHTSGLPRMPTNFSPADRENPYADYTPEVLYAFLSTHVLIREPGVASQYSNVGVGLLGHALTLAAGKSYEELQRERIWTPLGMRRTAITLTPWMQEHLAVGHDQHGQLVANWDIAALEGAGAIRSTADDLLTFLAAALHTDHGLLAEAMAFTQQAHRSPGATSSGPLSWATRVTEGDTILWHNGGTGGYRTYFGLRRSTGTAVVVLTNSGGAGSDDIGFHLLDQRIPLASPAASSRPEAPALAAMSAGLLLLGSTVGLARWRRRRRHAR